MDHLDRPALNLNLSGPIPLADWSVLASEAPPPDIRHHLIWLLRLDYEFDNPASYRAIDTVSAEFRELIYDHLLNKDINHPQSIPLQVTMDSMSRFSDYLQRQEQKPVDLLTIVSDIITRARGGVPKKKAPKSTAGFEDLLTQYPEGTVLNCIAMRDKIRQSIAARGEKQAKQPPYDKSMTQLLTFLTKAKEQYPTVTESSKILQIATLFNQLDLKALKQWDEMSQNPRTMVKQEWDKVINHLLSIDYKNSNLSVLKNPKYWQLFMKCMSDIKKDPLKASQYQEAFMAELSKDKDLIFKSSSGIYRVVGIHTKDKEALELNLFADMESPLWRFFQDHIVVRKDQDFSEAVQPTIKVLKKLASGTTLVNELDALVTTLQKIKPGYWNINYLNSLLTLLNPERANTPYPLALLTELLNCHISGKSYHNQTLTESETGRTSRGQLQYQRFPQGPEGPIGRRSVHHDRVQFRQARQGPGPLQVQVEEPAAGHGAGPHLQERRLPGGRRNRGDPGPISLSPMRQFRLHGQRVLRAVRVDGRAGG